MALAENQRYIKPEGVLVQDLNGEAVLLNLVNGQYYGLDAVGYRMYHLLVTAETVDAARQTLLEEFDVTPEQLRQDLENLLQHLLENGLVARA